MGMFIKNSIPKNWCDINILHHNTDIHRKLLYGKFDVTYKYCIIMRIFIKNSVAKIRCDTYKYCSQTGIFMKKSLPKIWCLIYSIFSILRIIYIIEKKSKGTRIS